MPQYVRHCGHSLRPRISVYLAYTGSFFFNLYNDRMLLYWAMCCPPDVRKKDTLVRAIISKSDNRLLKTPFLYKYIKRANAALRPEPDLFDL